MKAEQFTFTVLAHAGVLGENVQRAVRIEDFLRWVPLTDPRRQRVEELLALARARRDEANQ